MKTERAILLLLTLFVGGYLVGRISYSGGGAPAAGPAVMAPPAEVAAAPSTPTPSPTPSAAPSPSPSPSPAPAAAAAPSAPSDPNQIWKLTIHPDDAKKGPDSANVVMVVFGSFGNQETTDFAPAIAEAEKAFGNKIQIRYKHKVVPFPHPDAIVAAEIAASCNAQGKFWGMFDSLIKSAALSESGAYEAAQAAGCNVGKAKADVAAGKFRKQVLRDSLIANEVAANTYPNVMVNGVRLRPPKTWDSLKPLIEEQLKKSETYAKEKGKTGIALYDAIIAGGKTFEQLGGPKQTFAIDGSPILGDPNAKIEIAVFEDFQCPFCSKIAPSVKEFQKKYPKDVKIVFKHMPLDIHDNAQVASEASMAALAQGPDKFWAYHDVLFNNQSALGRDQLETYAQQVGLDMARFKSDFASGTGKNIIQRDMQEGQKAGVSGTPSVYVNGMKYQGPRGYPPEGLEAIAKTYFGL
jgi:protein-disulfide isomerase